ncbi:asparagine-tRNA ligase [Acanthamoeba castellanii str. Neff]|uniref:asparagine--tRNA ligase n=1 Tax=Acanthamoeba castellanii (strain ATCC 30010 / Neff) TaxID=1257118 RepID=L8GNP1_ACACF|nr:asparagine-tRNA ligase [Acanthamoeba castellanii str. Neff]ELR14680.1 asparagine-tRNA ligase [Acanthamoeba castellanii str. Neff]
MPWRVSDILSKATPGQDLVIKGWVRTVRQQKQHAFVELSDGSHQTPLQIVATPELVKGIEVEGKIVESPAGKQKLEMVASRLNIIGACDPEKYPLAKKKHSLEFMREIPHLRARTNTIGGVLRVRDTAASAIRDFFHENGFIELHTPILTSSDCEGTCDEQRPREFFDRTVGLTVSGQLQAEMAACALSRVYTFGPTFRADNSMTRNHLAEFWMIEPEIAFCDLNLNMRVAEHMVKAVIEAVLAKCDEDMAFFHKRVDEGLMARLHKTLAGRPLEVTYTDAVKLLEKSGKKFEFPVAWGLDLQKEHERYLVEFEFDNRPVFVTHYPKDIKPFYMKLDEDGRTVQAMDLLVPTIGELIGGSVREENLDTLQARMKAMNMNVDDYQWYLDLRRFGTVPHAGFGLGFERLLQYVTGMDNIRDVIPVPRYRGYCRF